MKRVRQALSLLAIPFLVAQASLEASILHLSEGCLQLLRTAGFEIGYRTGDGVVHHMPTGWQGCYEGTTGLSCAEREINGRQAWLLLHPWKIHKEARIFLGYEVQLPEARKLELRFSVMMDPVSLRIQENGKTAGDGVNFSVEVNDECLFEYFGNDGAPRDFSVDLSRFSGQLVRLRLLADRGPNGDSEHDLAYYVEPVILADGAVVGRESRESPVFPGYRFPADLRAVRNSAGNGILPSNSCNFSNGTALLDGAARLSYHGEDGEITYVYRPETGTLDDLQCLFPNGRLLFPAVGGGIFFAGSAVPEKTRLLDFRQDGQEIVSRWQYEGPEGAPVVGTWRFSMSGKNLNVKFASDAPGINWISLGTTADARKYFLVGRNVNVPYLFNNPVKYLSELELYDGRGFDWRVSQGTEQSGNAIRYLPKTDGFTNPVNESAYICLSPDLHEVLPNIPHLASPWRQTVGKLAILDYWGTRDGLGTEFRALKETIELYRRCGLHDLAVIIHIWQKHGYDVKLPDCFPSNPAFGGDDDLLDAINAAKEAGWFVSLHENYTDSYPDADCFAPERLALTSDGDWVKAWFNNSTRMQSFAFKPAESVRLAKTLSQAIHDRYGTNSSYVDVISGMELGRWCDCDAKAPQGGKMQARYQANLKTWDILREIHGGPAFGEGFQVALYAGRNDGCEAETIGGQNHEMLVDFALLKMLPLQIDQGMGYMVRWLTNTYNTRWGIDELKPKTHDLFRAQIAAYAHTPWLDTHIPYYNSPIFVAREYYVLNSLQQFYGNANVESIEYEHDGQWLSSSEVHRQQCPWHLRVRYDSGLTLFINFDEQPWRLDNGKVLAQYGFLGLAPGMTAGQALCNPDGKLLDYAEDVGGWFVDPRTAPYVLHDGRLPRSAEFQEHLNRPDDIVAFPRGETNVCARLEYLSDSQLMLRVFPAEQEWTLSIIPPPGWKNATLQGENENVVVDLTPDRWTFSGAKGQQLLIFNLGSNPGDFQ